MSIMGLFVAHCVQFHCDRVQCRYTFRGHRTSSGSFVWHQMFRSAMIDFVSTRMSRICAIIPCEIFSLWRSVRLVIEANLRTFPLWHSLRSVASNSGRMLVKQMKIGCVRRAYVLVRASWLMRIEQTCVRETLFLLFSLTSERAWVANIRVSLSEKRTRFRLQSRCGSVFYSVRSSDRY